MFYCRFETKPLGVMVKLDLSKLSVNGDYDISGHILTFPVGGKGKATITVGMQKLLNDYEDFEISCLFSPLFSDKAVARVGMLFKLREDRGMTFTTLDNLRLDLQEVKGVYLNLEDADASQENAILNSYGDAIFEILRPTLNEALSKLFNDRWKKILAYVPADYIFADLPSAS